MKTDIQEGDKLIAEFDGWTFHDSDDFFYASKGDLHIRWGTDLQYNSSWDWLMPVVEKIEGLGFTVVLQKGLCQIFSDEYPCSPIEFSNKSNNNEISKITLCCLTVVEFIKWYNQNKEK